MTLKSKAKFPSRLSYVLKMRSDATVGALVGRLENMVTGRQRDFASADQLVESIASDLEACNDVTASEALRGEADRHLTGEYGGPDDGSTP